MIDKTSLIKDEVCFLVPRTNFTFWIHWKFFMDYENVFSDDTFLWLSQKRRVDDKIELITGIISTCKVSYLLALNKLAKCRTQMKKNI